MRILVLGANGLIGNTILRVLSEDPLLEVFGTVRIFPDLKKLDIFYESKIFDGVDTTNSSKLIDVIEAIKPEIIINCIGITKHRNLNSSLVQKIESNALFPHKLAQYAQLINARLIHISTDCVFSGKRGGYTEIDEPDANDIYGRSKALGEVFYGKNLTIRTSTIGHELTTNFGLLNWFLSQKDKCIGYKNAIFSGFPTVILAEIIRDYIIFNPDLTGLYHVGSHPISKYELLNLISRIYDKKIIIEPDEYFNINRSLDSSKFQRITGFKPPDWESLIYRMYKYQ